jgi:hypothetical protein
VFDAFLIVLTHPPPESRLIDDFANVLENKVAIVQHCVCS